MSSLNQVNLIGRLGQDPEFKALQNGGVANLSLATSEKWRDKQSGEQKEATEWHRVVVYGKLAEICRDYLSKGGLIYIEGSLKTRKWQDQSGQDRYTTEIVAKEMRILHNPNHQQGQGQSGQQNSGQARQAQQQAQNRPAQQPAPRTAPQGGAPAYDDDIPF